MEQGTRKLSLPQPVNEEIPLSGDVAGKGAVDDASPSAGEMEMEPDAGLVSG